MEQQQLKWEKEAERLFEETRVGLSVEGQMARMALQLRRGFLRITDPNWALTGSTLVRNYRRCFPPSHRPPGTLLYGFSRDQSGRVTLLAGPGLERHNGRILVDIFTWMLQPPETRPPPPLSLSRRWQALFGGNTPLNMVGIDRQGLTTPAGLPGRAILTHWDVVATSKKVIGAFLIITPFRLASSETPRSFALLEAQRMHPGMIPVLVPLPRDPSQNKISFPPRFQPSRWFHSLVERLARFNNRDRIPLLGQLNKTIPGLWVMRNFLAADIPFELWVFSRQPTDRGEETLSFMIMWGLLCLSFWGYLLSRRPRSGTGVSIGLALTMRQWVMTCIVFLAALALATLRFSALYYIETSTIRQIQEAEGETLSRLEEIDTGVNSVFDHFSRQCGRLAFNGDWIQRFLSGGLAGASEAVHLAERALAKCRPPISLNFLLRYRTAETITQRTFALTTNKALLGDSLPVFFQPFMEEGARDLGFVPVASAPIERSSGVFTQMFGDILRASMKEEAFRDFKNYRQRTDILENSRMAYLHYYDFMAIHDRLAGMVFFLTDAAEAYSRYLRLAVPRLDASQDAWFAVAMRQNDGCRIMHPSPGSLLNSRQGHRLDDLMQLTAVAGSSQVEQIVTKQHEELSILTLPCSFAKGFILGAVLPLRQIHEWREVRMRQLGLAMAAFLCLVILLGRAIANHLLDPLVRVEEGLRQVAAGNLEQRLDLERGDELGDLSSAFDQLLQGLRERRDLSRFVSGDVDVLVSQKDLGESMAPRLKVGTVLVSDLRNFTTLSEIHPPATIVAMLNRHHQMMVEAILEEGGSVELFIGDAVVAVFYDRENDDAPRRAEAAAIGMRRRHAAILVERRSRGQFTYEMGVGIDRGEVLVGAFGRAGKLEHTVLGPPRIRAEHLETTSKKGSHSRIMVSPTVADFCPNITFSRLTSEALEVVTEVVA